MSDPQVRAGSRLDEHPPSPLLSISIYSVLEVYGSLRCTGGGGFAERSRRNPCVQGPIPTIFHRLLQEVVTSSVARDARFSTTSSLGCSFPRKKMMCPCPAPWGVCPFLVPCSPGPSVHGLWIGQVEVLCFALLSWTARAGSPSPGSSPCPHPYGKQSAMPSVIPILMAAKTNLFSEKL